jgi:hypothetical protein
MEIKKIGTPPTKIHWSEGALFEVRFLQIQAEKFSVYCYLWLFMVQMSVENDVKQFFEETLE